MLTVVSIVSIIAVFFMFDFLRFAIKSNSINTMLVSRACTQRIWDELKLKHSSGKMSDEMAASIAHYINNNGADIIQLSIDYQHYLEKIHGKQMPAEQFNVEVNLWVNSVWPSVFFGHMNGEPFMTSYLSHMKEVERLSKLSPSEFADLERKLGLVG